MHNRRTDLQRDLAASVAAALPSDPLTHRRAVLRGEESGPAAASLTELGIADLLVPEKVGGLGLGWAELAVVNEVIGGTLVFPEGVLAASAAAAVHHLDESARAGSRLRECGLDVGIAVAATTAGRWWSRYVVHADRDGEALRLTGDRLWAVNGRNAKQLLTVATGADGDVLALVDTDQVGVKRAELPTLTGARTDAIVTLQDAHAEPLGAADAVGMLLTAGALAAGAQAVAASDAALAFAVEHATVRQQFGRQIGSFQAVAHQCARAAIDLELTRSQLVFLADSLDAGTVDDNAALVLRAAVAERLSALMRTVLHVLGGIGFTAEHDLHLYLKHTYYLAETFGGLRETRGLLARRCISASAWSTPTKGPLCRCCPDSPFPTASRL